MSTSIRPTGAPGAGALPEPLAPARGAERFADTLRAQQTGTEATAEQALRAAARDLIEGERHIERVMRAARSGKVFSQEELLAVQAGVYRYSQQLEIASKLVDRATSAVKTTLQSQQ
ncbi:MAG: hypothetical protein RMK74_02095 [Myxococcales bacterium]|nr:hypothetical protein [Myxococcales bacterium]